MSVINSSSTNDSTPSPFSSFYPGLCFTSVVIRYMQVALDLTSIILLVPLSVSVLYLGFQRWKQQRSVSSAAVMSLSDFVTYNMSAMELIGVLGNTFSFVGAFIQLPVMNWLGVYVRVFPWNGQMLFPILTSLERYLAVVHPITYLRLKQTNGARFRNISTVYVWLQCFAGLGIMLFLMENPKFSFIASLCQMVFFLTAVTFCSLSVLRVLIRPPPGKASGDRVDPSKKRAFHTIIIIMGVLHIRFAGNLVCNLLGLSSTVSDNAKCVATASTGWCNLPSSLMLPLLFLHRAGTLPGCKHNIKSG